MFETVTLESPWAVPASRRTRLLGGAFLLHASAATAYLVATLWSIRPVAPPRLLEAFQTTNEPPQVSFTPLARSQPSIPPATSAPPTTAPAVAQPREVAALDPAAASAPGLESNVVQPISATGGGEGLFAIVDQAADSGFAGTDGDPSRRFAPGTMTPPRILFRSEPKYPELARKVRKEGVVVIEAEIGRDGVVRSARTVNPALGFGLEASALQAVSSWRFTPASYQGRPVSVLYNLTVRLTLN